MSGGEEMAKYQCSVCGYIFDEEREGKSLEDLQECPVCHQSRRAFELDTGKRHDSGTL